MELVKSAEWYTRPRYIEAAREVLGEIDLDPASCAEANQIVKARRFYTMEDNGLEQDWTAETIWLNPPFGRTAKMAAQRKSTIALFTEKLLQIYAQGKVKAAIILATTEVNAKWFYPLWGFPVCIPDHRVKFIVPAKTQYGKYSQMFGTSFVYLGPNAQLFTQVFERFGVVKPASILKPRIKTLSLDWSEVEEHEHARLV